MNNLPRILILGAHGLLGQSIQVAWKNKADLFMPTRNELDICLQKDVEHYCLKIKPDIIVNLAAYTKVDLAEDEIAECYRVNVVATEILAVIAQKINAFFCYISTDYVFDGIKGQPYIETDIVNPISVYGRSKYLGELAVRSSVENYLIVRVSWLYGLYASNFVEAILKKVMNKESLCVIDDQIGSPTFASDVASVLFILLQEKVRGTFHLTSKGYCSWYEFACEILKQEKLTADIKAVSTENFPQKAKRPSNSVLSTNK